MVFMYLTNELITILKRGVPVFGTIQKAYSRKDALAILDKCSELGIIAGGGDVVEFKESFYEYNYDNWSCERKKNEADVDYALRSIKKAIKYISEYKKDEAYFVLVLNVKDENIKQYLFFDDITL